MNPNTSSAMITIPLIFGGAIFGLLGALHTVYTLLDLHNPRRLVPVDPSVTGDGQFGRQIVEWWDEHVASLDWL